MVRASRIPCLAAGPLHLCRAVGSPDERLTGSAVVIPALGCFRLDQKFGQDKPPAAFDPNPRSRNGGMLSGKLCQRDRRAETSARRSRSPDSFPDEPIREALEQSSAPLRSFPFINVCRAGLFLTTSDGGMRHSSVRRKNKTAWSAFGPETAPLENISLNRFLGRQRRPRSDPKVPRAISTEMSS